MLIHEDRLLYKRKEVPFRPQFSKDKRGDERFFQGIAYFCVPP